MVKRRLLQIFVLLFTLPALGCSLIQATDLEDTATQIAADIYATMTAEAPTATYTATKTPTEAVTPTPANRYAPANLHTQTYNTL